MKKIQCKGWIVGIIIFISILLIGSITFTVLVKQINKRTPLEKGEQYMDDILPNKTPSEIILHYGSSEVPVKDKEDIKAITEMMYPMIVVEEEKNERLQDSSFSMDLVYKGQTSSIVFTLQGLEINDKVYVPRESEMQCRLRIQKLSLRQMICL